MGLLSGATRNGSRQAKSLVKALDWVSGPVWSRFLSSRGDGEAMATDARDAFAQHFAALLADAGLQAKHVATRVNASRPRGALWSVTAGLVSAWKTGRNLPSEANCDGFFRVVRLLTEHARGRALRGHQVGELLDEVAWTRMLKQARAARPSDAVRSSGPGDVVAVPLIERAEYIQPLHACIAAGRRIVCIWGEPGTGKTVLASQFAASLNRDRIITLRAADPKVLQADIIEALIREGLKPTNWSQEYSHAMLRQVLAEQPNSAAVIVDNVDSEDLVWQLLPKNPAIPVILTMRMCTQSPAVANLELHDFTESQSCKFIHNHLGRKGSTEVIALARVTW